MKKAHDETIHKKLLQSAEEDRAIFASFLNIFLVYKHGRNATLIETSNLKSKSQWNLINDYIKLLSLEVHLDQNSLTNFPRYFVYHANKFESVPDKSEKLIGKALGMYCPGGEYSDTKARRYMANIMEIHTNADIYAEVCNEKDMYDELQFRKSLDKKVKKWNKVCENAGLPYKFAYAVNKDDGTAIRFTELCRKNTEYLEKYKDEYLNDFWNVYGDNSLPMYLFTHSWRQNIGFLKVAYYLGCYTEFAVVIYTEEEAIETLKEIYAHMNHTKHDSNEAICEIIKKRVPKTNDHMVAVVNLCNGLNTFL